jgi:hypothetical protein
VRYNPALLAVFGSASVVAEELAVRPSRTMRAPDRAEPNRCVDKDSYSHSQFLRLKSRRRPKRAGAGLRDAAHWKVPVIQLSSGTATGGHVQDGTDRSGACAAQG